MKLFSLIAVIAFVLASPVTHADKRSSQETAAYLDGAASVVYSNRLSMIEPMTYFGFGAGSALIIASAVNPSIGIGGYIGGGAVLGLSIVSALVGVRDPVVREIESIRANNDPAARTRDYEKRLSEISHSGRVMRIGGGILSIPIGFGVAALWGNSGSQGWIAYLVGGGIVTAGISQFFHSSFGERLEKEYKIWRGEVTAASVAGEVAPAIAFTRGF